MMNTSTFAGLILTIALIGTIIFFAVILLTGGVNQSDEYWDKDKVFSTDVYSFDNKIIFQMNAKNVNVTGNWFWCSIDGKDIDSSCYNVYHETNDSYAKKTFVIVFCDGGGNNFTDGQLIKISAMYSHPDWDYDYYNDLNICHSCIKINHGWYPYACY